MKASIDGAVARLSRAYLELIALQQQVQSCFPPAQLWPLAIKEHRPGIEYRLYLGNIPQVDREWALTSSEILFNARCALDYLVYELHVRRYRGTVPAAIEHTSMFPIFNTEASFKNSGQWRIKNLGLRDKRAIKYFQPYETRRDGWHFTRKNLSLLSALQNIDKHRKLHVVTAVQGITFLPQFPESCGFRSDDTWSAVESGDHVQTWTFTSAPPKVESDHSVGLAVALDGEMGRFDLLGTLSEIVNHVSLVVERFADRFPKVPRPYAWRPDWWMSPVYQGVRPLVSRSLFLP